MKKTLLVAGALAVSLLTLRPASAQDQLAPTTLNPTPLKPAATYTDKELQALGEGIAFPFELMSPVLLNYVDNKGDVFYAKLKGDNNLEVFVRAAGVARMDQFPVWTNTADPNDPNAKTTQDRDPETTFWINVYNAMFIKSIADNYPFSPGKGLSSIPNFDTGKTHVVGGKSYSFADMRKIIANLDIRALFALTDGSRNGPRLQGTVYHFYNLDPTLDAVTEYFVNDPSRVQVPERLDGTVAVSPWFASVEPLLAQGKSSRQKYPGTRSILQSYTKRPSDRSYFNTTDVTIKFMEGDPSLNEQLSR